ncbi:MAG TPA: tyrosine-type recombinase/integrase [Mycobacteriales bacterium]|nr:tyrosine-type recombinase/integrase [Mycobacteriales bacterium]
MRTYDVRIWKIRPVTRKAGRRYEFRWRVGTEAKSRTFANRALADSFRSELVRAARSGEAFDTVTGMPDAMARRHGSDTWLDHAMSYVAMKWPRASAKHRASIADALATVTPALFTNTEGMPAPATMRATLYGWAFNMAARNANPDAPEDRTLPWLRKHSRRVADLDDLAVIRRALDLIALKLDGKPAAATTVSRKRAVFYNCLRYAVELRMLPANPLDIVQWTPPEVSEEVDPRIVINPGQAHGLLDHVRAEEPAGPRLVAFFGCLYYGGLRPGEATALRQDDCVLPLRGWGSLTLSRSEARAGTRWTDEGTVRDIRGLKHRGVGVSRTVPIPPVLVALLRDHLANYGAGDDGRLFRGERGRPLQETVYGRLWKKARDHALTPAQVASPLASRPYDLRHAAVSLWLNAGVPATEVAARAGHSVHVLLKVYAKCIDGQTEAMNVRIERALAA